MKKPFKPVSIILLLLLVSVCGALFFIKPPLLADKSFSRAIYADNQQLLRLTLTQDDKYRLYTPLSQISPQLIAATLLQEDQYFKWHFGVNPIASLKAIWQTYVAKSRRMGASTITMQVARIRFGINSKTLLGKIEQIARAIQLEMHYSKNKILEAYLNLAPYGSNIEGVGAASIVYFGKSAKEISLPEAITLAVIPQNPTQRIPQQNKLKDVRNKLFNRWLTQHPQDRDKAFAMNLPLEMQTTHHLPFLAPHFVNRVLLEAPRDQKTIRTTLDLALQKAFENVAHSYLNRKKNLGVYNTAILVVDTRDMEIKTLIGSDNFFNTTISGQINGTETRRSPGSTLKPFIYALALDQGLIHPNTVLKDVPHSFGSYNPENFDYDFMGPIKAKDALVLSRNIPAIYLAEQLNHPSLYQFLEEAHIKNLKAESYYGLALALGGAELSMQELVGLYSVLVNEGIWYPLRVLKEDKMPHGNRILSREASFLILDILKNTPRSEGIVATHSIPIAWKTGTSSGYRDAWTIGIVGPYVIAVWIGNFDNTSNHAFVGKNIAAPLFFELVNALQRQKGGLVSESDPRHLHLIQIPVCKASGMLPTRYCLETELTWFIPGKSPIKTDTIFREVAIDPKTGLRTCHINQNTRFEIFEFWPSDLLKIFKQAGIQPRTAPFYDPSCSFAQTGTGLNPQITSPRQQISYIERASDIGKNQVPLTAVADGDVEYLYWFLNEAFLGKTKRDQPFLWVSRPGKFIVRVVDDRGRSDARELAVKVTQ